MKKPAVLVCQIVVYAIVTLNALAQSDIKDSLIQSLKNQKKPAARALTLIELAKLLRWSNDSKAFLMYAQQALEISKTFNFKEGEALSYKWIGFYHYDNSEFLKAQEYWANSLQAYQDKNDSSGTTSLLNLLGLTMFNSGDLNSAKKYWEQALSIARLREDSIRISYAISSLARIYSDQSNFEKAKLLFKEALQINLLISSDDNATQDYLALGELYLKTNQYDSSLINLNLALNISQKSDFKYDLPNIYSLIAENKLRQKKHSEALENFKLAELHSIELGNSNIFNTTVFGQGVANFELGNFSSALALFYRVKDSSEKQGDRGFLEKSLNAIAGTFFKLGNSEKAYQFQKQAFLIADSIRIYQSDSVKNFQETRLSYQKMADSIIYNKEKKQLELEINQIQEQGRFRTLTLFGIISTILIILGFLYYNNRNKQRTNKLLISRRNELESALNELRFAQSKLILAEKMASLGQLTSGIAHEIQNPLNFVNNFSEINSEMLVELKTEIIHKNSEGALAIIDDVLNNSEKLTYHGKRADSIVKSMLQHSRQGMGSHEATDLNKLADEVLRVSYKGVKLKHNSFHANINTDFDEKIGKLSIVPQDMSRVLLNLFNNSFYAMEQKGRMNNEEYIPTIDVKTRRIDKKVYVSVRDNGIGISNDISKKIFQPFFTTKPTGEGTGLGLSISYDIIKAHGGEIELLTEEGLFTEFLITLPD